MKWIERCLQSVRQSTIHMTPLVIDNQSTDGTVQYIQTHFPEVILLPQDKNLGFGQANNRGIEYALSHNATHVLLLNQDAYIAADAIDKLLKHDDGKHLLTPIHMNGDGSHIDDNFYRNTILAALASNNMLNDALIGRGIATTYDIDYVNAACWLLPVSIVRQVGGFNPIFFQYGEDNNYIQRIHFHLFGIRLVTDTFIYHDRKKHGQEALYQKGAIYRKLLLIRTDINLTAKERWFTRCKVCMQELGRSILKHYFLACLKDITLAGCRLNRQIKAIKNSRKTEMTNKGAWLIQ